MKLCFSFTEKCETIQLVTTLSNNIQRLRKEVGFTQKTLAQTISPKLTGKAVSLWERKVDATVPIMPHLYALANIFSTTIDELYSNPKAALGLTIGLNKKALTKTFEFLANEKGLNYALETAPISERVYLFSLIYSLAEDHKITVGKLSQVVYEAIESAKQNKSKAKKATGRTRKRG